MKRFVACLVASVVAVASVLVGGFGPVAARWRPEPARRARADVGVTPVRVLEPVVGGVGGGPMAADDERTLTVTGIGSIPATVEAVDLTVTAVRQGGTPRAKIFVSTGGMSMMVPALTVKGIGSRGIATVTVAPSATGEITVRADLLVDVQIDVRGYFAVDAGFTAALDAGDRALDDDRDGRRPAGSPVGRGRSACSGTAARPSPTSRLSSCARS